ncbi:MAG: hypothetical protein AB1567_09145 [bacterium]
MWYKAWASIQDGFARTTPGKAVGFLFIPFYNFYWIFQVIWGFAKDYNSYIDRHGVSASKLPEGLFLSSCILSVLGIVLGILGRFPWFALGIIVHIIVDIIEIIILIKTCDAVNSLQ